MPYLGIRDTLDCLPSQVLGMYPLSVYSRVNKYNKYTKTNAEQKIHALVYNC